MRGEGYRCTFKSLHAYLHGEHVGELIDALLELFDVSLLRLDRAL